MTDLENKKNKIRYINLSEISVHCTRHNSNADANIPTNVNKFFNVSTLLLTLLNPQQLNFGIILAM